MSNNSTGSSLPPPPASASPPPPSSSPPPPPSSSPPPPSSDSAPPPPSQSSPPPDDSSQSPPPPPKDSKSSPPPSPYWNSNSPPPPPPPPPPPGSSHRRSPPPPLSSSEGRYSSNGNGSSNNNNAIITGVVIVGGILLLFMVIFFLACGRRRKRKPHDQMLYYRDNSTGNKSSDYYNSGPGGSNWNTIDHAIKIPQVPPPPPGHVSSEHFPVMPPPPPPAMSSSEMSSAGFSGGPAPLPPPHPSLVLGFSQSMFTYKDLASATGGFAKANLLGQGGFGYVHKGVLPNGKEVAVKSLKSGSGQGEREFQAEVEIISRVHHRHLVSLVGYCIADTQRMLVYEFVPNNSLEYHLHGKGQAVMDFASRLKIALGSAKGFAYLHEDCHPRIIHRDIKAANILLDYNYEAKVADFGLAKLSNDNYTHVSTRIMGTFGYLAPEYAASGKLTEKSDVYSYGIVLLELITGRRPVDIHSDDDCLVDWARPILEDAIEGREYEELVDPQLNNEYDPHEMLRMVACAAASIRHSARKRPRMSQIVRALEGDASLEDLNEGMKHSSSAVFSSGSSDHDGSYNSEIKKFRKHPKNGMSSQEFTSSEQGVTGEFTIQPLPLRSVGDSQEFIRRLHL